MKKLMFLGFVVLGSSLMSFGTTESSTEKTPLPLKAKLVNYMCESGQFVQYYTYPGYSDADIADIRNALCG